MNPKRPYPSTPRVLRVLPAAGAVLAAVAVALSAYSAHAAEPAAAARLQSAALFAFGHGIALAALGPLAVRWPARLALMNLLVGTLLFSGSLVAAHFFATPTVFAPLGGGLMILAWLLWAVDAVRR
ncbi:MAG: DUF423 domain-containing protein [Lysobacter sp.]